MDALKFEYPDYERLSKGAKGPKRKRVVSVMQRQAARMIKEDEKLAKKKKSSPESKVAVSKKRKATAPKPKADLEEEIPSTPSATDAEEILKVMTESLPNKLSPLGPELMKLLQLLNQKREGLLLSLRLLKKHRRWPQRRKQQQPKLLLPKLLLPKLQQQKPQIWKAHFLTLMK